MNKILTVAFCMLMLMCSGAFAEVYKWKDKDGRTRYSDIPPPSNIPYQTLSGKKFVPTPPPGSPSVPAGSPSAPAGENDEQAAPSAPAAAPPAATPPAATPPAATPPAATPPAAPPAKSGADKELEAAKRRQSAEEAKKKEEEKQAEQKIREQNCAAAKSNLQTYQRGGRITRTSEQGEREYLDDATIARELERAKKDVEQWCGK